MAERVVKLPGPDHPISIAPVTKRIRIHAGSRLIADTTHSLELREAALKPVYYIPREDADMSALQRTERQSYCPYKGEASYYSVATENGAHEHAVWSYEEPFPAMAEIRGFLAFYPDRVTIEEAPERLL